MHLMGVYFMGVHLTSVHLIGMYLIHQRMQPFYLSRTYVFTAFGGHWPDVAFLVLALGPIAPPVEALIPSTLGHREGVGNTFNGSAIVLGALRFGLPGHFDVAGDLCAGKIYVG